MSKDKEIAKSGNGKAEGTNETNAAKLSEMIENAKKLTKKYKETSSDVDKENAENAAAAIIETLDKVKIEGYKKVKGTWYAVSDETRETWLTFEGEKANGEKVSITPEIVEEKFGRCLYVLNVIFAAGMVMFKGQATVGFFEKVNTTKTKSNIKDAFELKKEPRNFEKDVNAAAVKALSTFAAAVGATFDAATFDGVTNAAEVILSGAQKMIDNQSNEMREIARNKAISVAVSEMIAGGKVDSKKAAEYASILYADDCKLSNKDKATVIERVAAGKDFSATVDFLLN